MKKNRLTVREAAKALNVCQQRISTKYKSNHFPGAGLCECGRSIMIPRSDIAKEIKAKRKDKFVST